MSKGFGIHGSTTDHGGVVISTQSRSSQMGNLFLRAGDGFACPKCKCWSTLIKSNDHVIFDGKAVAYVGDKFTCGATLMPNQVHVVGDSGSSYGSSAASSIIPIENSFVETNQEIIHGMVYQLLDEHSNKPVANMYYKLVDPDGNVIEGETDENGHTKEITTGSRAQDIQFLTYDLSKPLPPMD